MPPQGCGLNKTMKNRSPCCGFVFMSWTRRVLCHALEKRMKHGGDYPLFFVIVWRHLVNGAGCRFINDLSRSEAGIDGRRQSLDRRHDVRLLPRAGARFKNRPSFNCPGRPYSCFCRQCRRRNGFGAWPCAGRTAGDLAGPAAYCRYVHDVSVHGAGKLAE